MTALAHSNYLITPDEYLSGEEDSDQKHEFLNGVVHAMAGGTAVHSRIAVNVTSWLHQRLRGNRCQPFNSDMRLRIWRGEDRRFYYPDVMVVCDPQMDATWQEKPAIVVEVLSEATRRTDLGEKRDAYLALPSLQQYVAIDSEHAEVLVWTRQPGGKWSDLVSLRDPTGLLSLPEIACEVPLAEIYEGTGLWSPVA